MKLSGVHLLLTYECNFECDHCFTWGSPWNPGTMTLENIRVILEQARDLGTVETVYFEGGEPFLYYAVLVEGVKEAAQLGFRVGIVTNVYWATAHEDAEVWLSPLEGIVDVLSISTDLYHWDELVSEQATRARDAGRKLGIPTGSLTIVGREEAGGGEATGQLPTGKSYVMHRGRAAEKLVDEPPRRIWTEFNECLYEELREPDRVHIDPLGYVHICQGISLGNVFENDLKSICENYDPDTHPIVGPLLAGGPAELVRRYDIEHEDAYVDACHICYTAREKLRSRFPDLLAPDQMYGVMEKPE